MRRCWFFVLSWSERRPWPALTPVDSAREIRLDRYPTHTQAHTTVRPHSGKNTLVAQLREHIEPWTLQTCLALVKTCAVDSVGQLLVTLIRRCDVSRVGPINGAGVFFFRGSCAKSRPHLAGANSITAALMCSLCHQCSRSPSATVLHCLLKAEQGSKRQTHSNTIRWTHSNPCRSDLGNVK